jgi:hypothetical protein
MRVATVNASTRPDVGRGKRDFQNRNEAPYYYCLWIDSAVSAGYQTGKSDGLMSKAAEEGQEGKREQEHRRCLISVPGPVPQSLLSIP